MSEWRKVTKTSPRNGKLVLGLNMNAKTLAASYVVTWRVDDQWFQNGPAGRRDSPTHWAELPPAPKVKRTRCMAGVQGPHDVYERKCSRKVKPPGPFCWQHRSGDRA